ncbi:MAG: YbaB/EbfC family nucleoid-associated protein [Candidatus Komeilibacteria bacterium]|jgi:DNA-binding protein YbaB|nr:YbaB/EbfC family nucleoid-associated protein [Candidatus Komeilibacteria bacterium]MBT4447830.1 YbaB/EbfC family nucleoid-associated protein [Candidatus Komeilibacteria bacterium]
MFNKLKQYNDLRKQANTIKSAMSEESVEVSNKAVTIIMDGNQEITSLDINEDFLSKDKKKELEKEITNGIANAIKKVQRKMAMKMQQMGGLDNLMK